MFCSIFVFSFFLAGAFVSGEVSNDDKKFGLQSLLRRRFSRQTCAPNTCLSQWNFCGTGSDYCGPGCREGPCGSSKTEAKKAAPVCLPKQCLSQWSYCGTGLAYCGNGCKAGNCGSTGSGSGDDCADKKNCRSQWGDCGTGSAFCGSGCQAGPCIVNSDSSKSTGSSIITSTAFACVFNTIDTGSLKKLYSVLQSNGWKPTNKDEAAVFLAHVFHETAGLSAMREQCTPSVCSSYSTTWCEINAIPGKLYYGRGWFHLTGPCNYYRAGKALAADLLNNPDNVENDPDLSMRTAIWYYTANGMDGPAQQGDFAITTKLMNGAIECSNGQGYKNQLTRVETYKRVRTCFGLGAPTKNPVC